MLTKNMKKQLNKLLQKEAKDAPSVDHGGQLPKMDKESLVTIHIEEQNKWRAKSLLKKENRSIDTRVYSMDQIIVIM